jgi:pimeloyl-ACP methyl ester carboxylesterase
MLEIWTADTRFVLDRLTSGKTHDAADSVTGHLQVDRVGTFGHSFGGATAAEVMAHDQRVKAGIDMDGLPGGDAARQGLDRPFLVFRSGRPDPDSLPDAMLRRQYGTTSHDAVREIYQRFDAQVNSLLQFGGTEVRMDGAEHLNFSDLPLWSPFLMRRLGLVGSDNIVDVHTAITALTMRFFNQYLREREPTESVALPPHVQVQVVPHQSRVK